jgi:hypothetical protein
MSSGDAGAHCIGQANRASFELPCIFSYFASLTASMMRLAQPALRNLSHDRCNKLLQRVVARGTGKPLGAARLGGTPATYFETLSTRASDRDVDSD